MDFIWNSFVLLCVTIAMVTVIVFYVGDRLAFYAEQLSIVTNISGAFIGFVLIAMITSMPEMVSAFVSVTNGAYGLVVGGMLGSNAINIAILSIILLIFNDKKIKVQNSSIFSFLSSLILLAVVGIAISSYHVSGIILNKYLIASVTIFIYYFIMKHAYDLSTEHDSPQEKTDIPLNRVLMAFLVFALAIIFLSWFLVMICQQMAIVPVPIYGKPLGEHFIGTLILAFATSVPELATTFQIVRRGMTNMAIENISGSNIFNLMTLVVSSIFAKSDFWSKLPINSLYTVFVIFILSLLICVVGLVRESKKFTIGVYIVSIAIWVVSLAIVF